MKTSIDVTLEPFNTPNFVTVQIPGDDMEASTLPLSAFDSLTLDRLCREFRDEVFQKAGKEQPPEQAR
jgi:hypothetical protein